MGALELLLIAIGLSMDAFAVAVGKGLSTRRLRLGDAALIALFFGGFQALMPVLGWLVGEQFDRYVSAVEGWVAFGLLAAIGAKMIWDALHDDDGSGEGGGAGAEERVDLRELAMLAVATSIDAFAAGVAFALLDVNIATAAAFIGAVTFALSLVGVGVGHLFGSRWERVSSIAGGIVLIAIGLKTLLEGLMR